MIHTTTLTSMSCTSCTCYKACHKFGDNCDVCDVCYNDAIGNWITSYRELNEMYDIDSNVIFSHIISRNGHLCENRQNFEAKFLHIINKITDVEQKKYYMHIYNRNHKLREIKKYIVDRYHNHFTYDDVHHNYFTYKGAIRYRCISYCQFKFGDYLKFKDLSEKFTESNNKIANEYAYSLETEEEVKIKLDENFKKYNEIANNLKKKAALVYELIYIELCTLIELDDDCKMAFELFAKRIGDIQFLKAWSKNIFKCFKNKYICASQHTVTIMLYDDFVKYHGNREIEKILCSFDPNVRTLNDIKKTDIVKTVHKIIHDANCMIIIG